MLRDMTSLVTPKFLVVRFPKGGKTTVAYELAWSLEAVLVDFDWEPPGGLGIVGGGREGVGRHDQADPALDPQISVHSRRSSRVWGPAVLAEA